MQNTQDTMDKCAHVTLPPLKREEVEAEDDSTPLHAKYGMNSDTTTKHDNNNTLLCLEGTLLAPLMCCCVFPLIAIFLIEWKRSH